MQFRRASIHDAPALAELICLAGESPSARSSYDLFFGGTRDVQLDRLKRLIRAGTQTHFSYSNFHVAEVDGAIAAAACGFDPRISGREKIVPALRETGWSGTEIGDAMERFTPILTCLGEELQNAWVLEHVATFPRFRARGLAKEVACRVIDEGFGAGFDRVQVSLFIGNEIAKGFYGKLGFKPAGLSRTDPQFERVMGSPGRETLVLGWRDWREPSPRRRESGSGSSQAPVTGSRDPRRLGRERL